MQKPLESSEMEPVVGVNDFALLERCANDAQQAILGLWEAVPGTFWRSTEQRKRDKGKASFFPTVTLRCADSLLALLAHCPDWVAPGTLEIVRTKVVPAILGRDDGEFRSTLDTGSCLNVFTASLHVRALTRIRRLGLEDGPDRLTSCLRQLAAHPVLAATGTSSDADAHPFLLCHAIRALASAATIADGPAANAARDALARQRLALRRAVERLLARRQLGGDTPGDAVALGFCAAGLLHKQSHEDLPYAIAALAAALDAQDSNGCWPLGRVVRAHKDVASDRLEIPTHEIFEALAGTALLLLRAARRENAPSTLDLCVRRLRQAAVYMERSVVHLPDGEDGPGVGWCSDHAYGSQMVESWTSATVLSAAVAHRRLLLEFRRRQILKTFAVVYPDDRNWPPWLRWDHFRVSGEVDHACPVLDYLERHLVQPIRSDARGLPGAGDSRSVSAPLLGPPGTSKTTMVKAVADALGWPVILLSPGTFIEKGLEYIEAQARSTFDRLLELSHAVVVFDECDELFRDRTPIADTEQTRGITAFVTASMLPKLQELHDRGRVLFFVCTNHFEAIDAAVKRGGRIDHVIGVGPPDRDARSAMLSDAAKAAPTMPANLDAALRELADRTERFTRSEVQRAFRLLLAESPWASPDQARSSARAIVDRMEGALTIGATEYATFKEQRKQHSHPVLEASSTKSGAAAKGSTVS